MNRKVTVLTEARLKEKYLYSDKMQTHLRGQKVDQLGLPGAPTCFGAGGVGGLHKWKVTFRGDEYAHYLNCVDSFMSV